MRRLFLCLPMFLMSAGVFAQTKAVAPLQAFVVTTENWSAVNGTARRFERRSGGSKWKSVGKPFAVVVGKSGTAWGAGLIEPPDAGALPLKIEGDGKSPAGIFALASAFGSGEKPDFVKLSYLRLTSAVECVDDANSTEYNRIVSKNDTSKPDWKSSEKMLTVGAQYDLGVFVAHNTARRKGGGSCIFLHIWENSTTGTAGCTAMARSDIEKTLAWLDAEKKPVLIQMPETIYKSHQKSWDLPSLK